MRRGREKKKKLEIYVERNKETERRQSMKESEIRERE